MTVSERLAAGSVNLQYAQLQSWSADAKKLPPIEQFVPDPSDHEPKKPTADLTFDDWARAILPTGG